MRSGSRRLFAYLAVVAATTGLAAREFSLGVVAPPSDPAAKSLVRAVELAAAQASADGRGTVRVNVRRGTGQWGSVGNDAVVLVAEGRVDAIVAGTDGGDNHLILQVSGRTRVPVASLCSDASVTGAGVPWAAAVVPRNDRQAEALFAATRNASGAPVRWSAVVPAGRAGRTIRRDLETAARIAGVPLTCRGEDTAAEPDVALLIRAVLEAAPEGVLIWLPPARAGSFAATLRARGFRGRLAGPSWLASPEFVAAARDAATGVLVAQFPTDAATALRAAAFTRQYREHCADEPDAFAAAAYDAAMVLIETQSRPPAAAANPAFPPQRTIVGVTGTLDFDSAGNRTGALCVLACSAGRFAPISSVP
jgi:branched-chain amino acid transport system substrate-binding protein